MKQAYNLERFIDAQETSYFIALSEIKNGRKQTHWMWYIFPQATGLGHSANSRLYAIRDPGEAAAYLQHPVLGNRLVAICTALLALAGNDAHAVFGSPDDVKLKSSMSLFSSVNGASPVFQLVLDKFFDGKKDTSTIRAPGYG